MSDFTSFRSLFRRMHAASRAAKRAGGPMIDSMTAMQVADHAAMSTADLIEVATINGPRAAHWRVTAPAAFRRMPMNEQVGGQPERWRIGYLLDIILTRDPWMHRVDIARATGRPVVLTAEHDGRIVADVVAEWARRHGQPFSLTLTGPAGNEFVTDTGHGPHLNLDAVEFGRTLSGRTPATGLLAQQVPF
ncbi:hypothetical protein [Pseudonocardia sp. NPDC049635]|uniref:hypothetical protein n=1 Tax=Pseudonocardia sp. NPDC049635 TaxID=3155506 RepID=UPI0033D4CE6E